MTFKEKLKKEHPSCVSDSYSGGCLSCPWSYKYEDRDQGLCYTKAGIRDCTACWNRTIPGTVPDGLRAKVTIIDEMHTVQADWDTQCLAYIKADTDSIYSLNNILSKKFNLSSPCRIFKFPSTAIKKVIFNDPATIVIWSDGEKTVVKTQNNEPYDPEKGLAMAITKRALGNKGNYFDEIKKWTKKYEPKKKKQKKPLKASEVDVVAIQDQMRRNAKKRGRGLN